jgi:crotonobetainyl-CoA:carnitine CoA-transferase CaiB-like acyl-CoA transferase
MSDTPPKFFRPAPLLGEQTEEVLAKLGYDSAAVKELKASGVI